MIAVVKRQSLIILLVCTLFPDWAITGQGGCYLFVVGKHFDILQATQQIQPLMNHYVTALIEAPSEGIPERELLKSCYYEAGLTFNAGKLMLTLKSHMARKDKELNGLATSALAFPENVRQAMLRMLHREMDPTSQHELCKAYHDLLPETCPQIPKTVLFYRRNSKSEFADSSKLAVTVITNRLEKMLGESAVIDFTVMVGNLETETNSEVILPLLKQQNATAALVFDLSGEIQQSNSSMWKALAEISVSVTAFLIKDELLVERGTLDLSPERIPVRKWDTTRSYREKHFGRAARKLIKKWSEKELVQFMENLR